MPNVCAGALASDRSQAIDGLRSYASDTYSLEAFESLLMI